MWGQGLGLIGCPVCIYEVFKEFVRNIINTLGFEGHRILVAYFTFRVHTQLFKNGKIHS